MRFLKIMMYNLYFRRCLNNEMKGLWKALEKSGKNVKPQELEEYIANVLMYRTIEYVFAQSGDDYLEDETYCDIHRECYMSAKSLSRKLGI